MIETEVDEYKLNSETHQQSLHISLINNEKIAMILINKLTNQRYSSYLSLQSLKQLSQAFSKVNNIKDALTILKTTIESGNISLIEDTKDSSIYIITYEISLDSKKYPEFEVNLTLEESQNNEAIEENNLEIEGNPRVTTEYSKPIIDSNIKPPIVQLEYIEPILQVHYPDGTTKSTALPPRIQGADGEKADISEEQFKLIQEEIKKNTVSSFNINDNVNINRSNSAVITNKSRYSTQSTPYPGNNSMAKKNPFNNTVRPAMQNNNNNLNTINQVRSAFSSNPNHNYLKTSSDYTTMSVPYNKPFSLTNRDYQTQNNFNNSALYGNSQYFVQTHNPRNVIEERRPRMTNMIPNMQRNTERSLSTPGRYNLNNKLNQVNQANQTNYGYQPNQTNYNYQNKNVNYNNFGQNIDNNKQYNKTFNNSMNIKTNIQNNNSGKLSLNNTSSALKQSQELIQSHQKRIQEIQRQLALIQQQHQNLLQEQRKQLMLQQQIQGQINKKYTFTNNSNFNTLSNPNSSQAKKFKGFAQVNQIDRKNSSNSNNTQIRQAQTTTNSQASNQIKQSKTFLRNNNNNNTNPPLKTQNSNPLSFQAPKLETPYSNNNNNEDEIPNQYIALAQMASMQNQQNPEYQNLNAITLPNIKI